MTLLQSQMESLVRQYGLKAVLIALGVSNHTLLNAVLINALIHDIQKQEVTHAPV